MAAGVACAACAQGSATPGAGATGDTAFQAVVREDWRGYRDANELARRQYFSWNGRSALPLYATTPKQRAGVTLVQDPTFKQVVQILFPQMQGTPGTSVKGVVGFGPLDDVWVRFRVKFAPGWTTVGPDPAGHANAYKLAFLTWAGFNSRFDLGFIGEQYALGASAADARTGRGYGYTETPLPGSAARFGVANAGCGSRKQPPHMGDCEWHDNEWYEFVLHYAKTGPNTAVWEGWRRRLTRNNVVVTQAWTYQGATLNGDPGRCSTHAACPTPRVRGFTFGVNKNKNNPVDMYLRWGPFEVVDGSRYSNPFRLPHR